MNPHYTEAGQLVGAWEEKEKIALTGDLRDHILNAVSLYIERQNAPSQAHYMKAFEALTGTLSAVRTARDQSPKGMEIYAAIIEEWNRQNPSSANALQASLAWHRERGLLPAPV